MGEPTEQQATAALHILLHHPCINQHQLCKLLCVSKAVGAMITQTLAGELSVMCQAPKAARFPPWLARFGHLLKSLELNMFAEEAWWDPEADEATAEGTAAAVAAALVQAAAAPCRLQLASYTSDTFDTRILAALPASLTNLKLEFGYELEDLPVAAAALAYLTALQSLDIQLSSEFVTSGADHSQSLEPLLPGLENLHALTSLALEPVKDPLNLQVWLPQQLVELQVGLHEHWAYGDYWCAHEFPHYMFPHQPVNLSRLTALTKLDWSMAMYRVNHPPGMVDAGDVLPPNVRHLTITNSTSVQPLLQLQQLKRLDIMDSTTPASALQQLTALTGLSEVHLEYWWGPGRPHAAAPVWHELPLKHLLLADVGDVGAPLLDQLGRQQGLTYLAMRGFAAAPQQLATVLAQLTALQDVSLLHGTILEAAGEAMPAVGEVAAGAAPAVAAGEGGPAAAPAAPAAAGGQGEPATEESGAVVAAAAAAGEAAVPAAAAGGWTPVVGAIAGLAQLNNLELITLGLPLRRASGPALVQLTAATRLSSLKLGGCEGVDDRLLEGFAYSLTALKQLAVPGSAVTDAGMAAVADGLRQLTSINLDRTPVTDAGVEHFTRLAQLQRLQVGVGVSEAARHRALKL